MKTVIMTIAATIVAMAGQMAHAENVSPAWVCNMNFQGQSKGLQMIVGKTSLRGAGTIRCVGVLGETAELPVKIEMKSTFLSPTVAIGQMEVYGEAFNISLFNNDPQAILGDYIVAQADAAVIVGAGAFVATKLSLPDLNFRVGVEFNKGFGLRVGIQKMTISAR